MAGVFDIDLESEDVSDPEVNNQKALHDSLLWVQHFHLFPLYSDSGGVSEHLICNSGPTRLSLPFKITDGNCLFTRMQV